MADRAVDVLIVGAGAAGSACAEELRERGFDGSVLMAGRDPDPPYGRPSASKDYLRGDSSREDVLLHPAAWWAERDVELLTRVSAMKADLGAREVTLSSEGPVAYSRALLVATGANVRRLRVDGSNLEGIHYLRTLGTSDAIRQEAASAESVVLVGGSFIACEVAATLAGMGRSCTLVMLEEAPMANVFGSQVGEWVGAQMREHGVELVPGDGLERFEGTDRVERVVTSSGRELECDMVVMGTGVVPDITLARVAGLDLGESGGVLCDARLATSAPDVWVAGDIAEYDSVVHGRRLRVEHWEVAVAQGKHVAACLTGEPDDYTEIPYFWTDLGDWATLEYVGPAARWDDEEVRGSFESGEFSVFYRDGGRVVAALTRGRSEDLDEARELLTGGSAT